MSASAASVVRVQTRLLVLGGGRMGSALVHGLLRGGWQGGDVTVVERDPTRRAQLADEMPAVRVIEEPVDAEGVVVAVKPSSAEEAALALRAVATPRWLSIMAGVPLARLESWAGPGVAVVRAMPNTPALLGAGMTAIAAGSGAGEGDMAWAEALLGAVGRVVRVPEELIHAVTAVSGSGPAYVFLVAEALRDAGVAAGLDPALAAELTVATVAGAGRMLAESGSSPEELRAQVTSPGGTTEAALGAMEAKGLRQALGAGVAAAQARSRAMAEEAG